MEELWAFFQGLGTRVIDVLAFPLHADKRIFWVYLLTSAAVAWLVYRHVRQEGAVASPQQKEDASGTFLQFLFPKRVWSHPSAWLDLRYFLFHKVVSYAPLAAVGVFCLGGGYMLGSGGTALPEITSDLPVPTVSQWAATILFFIVTSIVIDFVGFICHYAQHKLPILWQFHKVHHSAEVMHPISNFREHPVDNLLYVAATSGAYGLLAGLTVSLFGLMPDPITLFGVPILMLLFNISAYNLRHSHVWLRWPGVWSKVFPSPAHHHVHHSRHPDHIDKNFAFMFPFWDVLFGTYEMPKDNRDVEFGVPAYDGKDLDTVLRLYWVPFRDVSRLLRKPQTEHLSPTTTVAPPPAPVSE